MRRFITAAMSLGALSAEAHVALAEAMNMIGGHSNSGEGGEDPRGSGLRELGDQTGGVCPFRGHPRLSRLGRGAPDQDGPGLQAGGGGPTPRSQGLRGDRPAPLHRTGHDSHLPAPPSRHLLDRGSRRLIYDLKSFKPSARVSVKLVSEPGVGTIAVGVAKADADVITVSGSEGGTGASPLVSIKHAGSPWELGLAEAHQALVSKGLRHRVSWRPTAGSAPAVTSWSPPCSVPNDSVSARFPARPRLQDGPPVPSQHLPGWDRHPGWRIFAPSSPVRPIRSSSSSAVSPRRHAVTWLASGRAPWRIWWAGPTCRPDRPRTRSQPICRPCCSARRGASARGIPPDSLSSLAERLVADSADAVDGGDPVELSYPIATSTGQLAHGSRARSPRHGSDGLPEGTIVVKLDGTAGQSFGAWLCHGVDLQLVGLSNDYVGKGMGGGLISVAPSRAGGSCHMPPVTPCSMAPLEGGSSSRDGSGSASQFATPGPQS